MTRHRPPRVYYLFGAGLAAGSLILMVPLVGAPLTRMVGALGYSEAECTIETSRARIYRDSDGDEHASVDIEYRYEVAGRTYRSRQYDLWNNKKGNIRAIVASLPPGAAVACFHDPDRPERAVIDRRLDPVRVLGVLTLLSFAFGVHLMRTTWRARHWLRRERRRHIELIGARPRRLALRRLGATLASRLALYGLLGPALLTACLHDRWGIVGQLVRGEVAFLPGVWIVLLMVFVLGATALFVHTVMRALGPRFSLATVQPARRGQAVALQWRATGVTPSIRSLSVQLVGREEADYERPSGDSTESGTDDREFYRRQLAGLTSADRSRLSHGSVTFDVPPFAFSFDGGNNRVCWTIILLADVAGWADVHEELELDIAP